MIIGPMQCRRSIPLKTDVLSQASRGKCRKKAAPLQRQRQIIGFILREMRMGCELTAAEIHPMLSDANDVTQGPVRKFIEPLERSEMVAQERRGRNVVVLPTGRGYHWL